MFFGDATESVSTKELAVIFSSLLSELTDTFKGLLEERKETAKELAAMQSVLSQLDKQVETNAKALFHGNGQQALMTRVALLEGQSEQLEDFVEKLEEMTKKLENFEQKAAIAKAVSRTKKLLSKENLVPAALLTPGILAFLERVLERLF